jgi:hypothetical protein
MHVRSNSGVESCGLLLASHFFVHKTSLYWGLLAAIRACSPGTTSLQGLCMWVLRRVSSDARMLRICNPLVSMQLNLVLVLPRPRPLPLLLLLCVILAAMSVIEQHHTLHLSVFGNVQQASAGHHIATHSALAPQHEHPVWHVFNRKRNTILRGTSGS